MPGENFTLDKMLCSRRIFLKSFGAAMAVAGISGSELLYAQAPAESLRYRLRREKDELNLVFTAIGFQEVQTGLITKRSWLRPTGNLQRLIFTLPPQYYAETALNEAAIPARVSDDDLNQIQIFPAGASQIVLQPRGSQLIELTLDSLFAWQDFNLVLPDTAANRQLYDLEYRDAPNKPTTQVEVPWGILLTPIEPKEAAIGDTSSSRYQWVPSVDPRNTESSRTWFELWSAALEDPSVPTGNVPMDVLGIHGFQRKPDSLDAGQHVHIEFKQNVDMPPWLSQDTSLGSTGSSLSNLDRIKIAASFSDRFPLDAQKTIDYILPDDSTAITGTRPCYIDGNAVHASEMRVSSRGASVISGATAQWRPGCILSAWNESILDGRDQEVEIIQSGWLFPFGIFALLVTRTERAFVPDTDNHTVAPLIKQTFIQIPQPNVAIFSSSNLESAFQSLTITTDQTPPLDVIPAGQLDWKDRDYFLPSVGGTPFQFQHVGIDWENQRHKSSMPLVFVTNNDYVDLNSCLIWEPGSTASTFDGGAGDPAQWKIAKHGDGLRVVDKFWNTVVGRFAKYREQIAVALPLKSGDTTQYVDWVEWTRSCVPDNLGRPMDGTAMRPFEARSRAMQIKLHTVSLFNHVDTFCLGTYRDTRFVDAPLLDPEPTADKELVYFCNLPGNPDATTPYLYLLETRAMVPISPAVTGVDAIYYNGSTLQTQRDVRDVLGNIDNEIHFGSVTPTDSIGALATPDTHCTALNRAHGMLGDSTFNQSRWAQHQGNTGLLQGSSRLDYAAYRAKFRQKIDLNPFDLARSLGELADLKGRAKSLMGYSAIGPLIAGTASPIGKLPAQLKLGDMFGQNAEVLPGIPFAKIFETIGIDPIPTDMPQINQNASARPLAWKFQNYGFEWISSVIGTGPDQMSLDDLVTTVKATQPNPAKALGAPMGIKGNLNWETFAFPQKVSLTDVGVDFGRAGNTRMVLNAELSVSLGININDGKLSLAPIKPELSAEARLESFSLTIFSFIQIVFSYIQFNVDASGAKKFDLQIQSVGLTDNLEFINQIANLFGSLGHGFNLEISPQRAIANLTMRFPPQEGAPLFIGPAQVTNLTVAYSVTIPLLSRDALSTSFAISSREKPLTIYIPPWYGGKSYFLIETATTGLRMLEVSMEYGGVISAGWGIARGSASLTAGVYYGVNRSGSSGTITFMAFVRAAVDLSIAGFIEFKGQVYIALGVEGNSVYGTAEVSVSIRIGFFHFSYSFTATHRDTRQDNAAELSHTENSHAALPASSITYSGDVQLWQSHPPLQGVASSPLRRDAYLAIINAYNEREQ